MNTKKGFRIFLFSLVTCTLLFASCESEDFYTRFSISKVQEYSYLSVSDSVLLPQNLYSNPTFIEAQVRFNLNKKVEKGKIVQHLSDEELMMSSNLLDFFYHELENVNGKIENGTLILYCNDKDPFDFSCCDASYTIKSIKQTITRSTEVNENSPFDIDDSTSDDFFSLIGSIESDRDGGKGANSFNEYVNINSVKGISTTKNYSMSINGTNHSYQVHIYNLQHANGGYNTSGLYDIATAEDRSSGGIYTIVYLNGRGDCLMSIQTRSREVYQKYHSAIW